MKTFLEQAIFWNLEQTSSSKFTLLISMEYQSFSKMSYVPSFKNGVREIEFTLGIISKGIPLKGTVLDNLVDLKNQWSIFRRYGTNASFSGF